MKNEAIKYCESIHRTKRRPTRVVWAGSVGIGGDHPIRVQSMTTSNTRDVAATVDQVMRLADQGCEIVRVTVQGIKEAEACESIKSALLQRGYSVPLVADIHFYPPAALQVVEFVEKVRINPGNFADKRASFKSIDYDNLSYEAELERIEEKFAPLVEKCKRLKRAMRIGTNHGSLSDRIMNRYGDTPRGMVESALEFARICRKWDYHNFVFSMKASNPQVMIQAYRLLAQEMYALHWDYPLHLGVTEAGEGENGRIKSAMGIGSLLMDGLGDTIRVSLTEDPWFEIEPCYHLIRLAKEQEGRGVPFFEEKHRKIDAIERRSCSYPKQIPLHRNGSVFLKASKEELAEDFFYSAIGAQGSLGQPKLRSFSIDALVLEESDKGAKIAPKIKALEEIGMGVFSLTPNTRAALPILSLVEALRKKEMSSTKQNFHLSLSHETEKPLIIEITDEEPALWSHLLQLKPDLLLFSPTQSRVHQARRFFDWLAENHLTTPVILHFVYDCKEEELVFLASMECGSLLCDGLGEGLWLEGPYPLPVLRELSFAILQAARMRMSKTDFISCPSCGRTLFDLQEVTRRIQKRTAHLPGVKIAIMGCIVNGPGEMADADFGYVGSKPEKIDLYVGKTCVEKEIDFSQADERLVDLIKAHGRWQEPEME